MPTHKTAHLQIAQADTRPKFAKELFSCRRTQAHPPPDKWTLENLSATFDNNRVLKIIFTNDKNEI